ncbi:MAG: hypothetical protein ACRDRC_14190 [Pseudonocardiaceae bacterium]
MNTNWGLELVLGEQLAQRRREAERDRIARLARSGDGGRRRRGWSVRWHAWMGLIRAAGTRLQHPPSRRGAEFSTTRDPQS